MKILHTSDLHLGLSLGEVSFEKEQRYALGEILRIADENSVGAVIIAGDVFDRAITSPWALEMYNWFATELCLVRKIPVIAIAGNHDSPERLTFCGEMLCKTGLFVSGRLERELEPVVLDGCAFWQLPFFTLSMVKSLYPNESFSDLNEGFAFVTAQLEPKMKSYKANICIAHCYVSGGELSESDRSAKLGMAQMISADCFKAFDYTALGHLHAPHFVAKKVRYSGTPYKYSFGEKGGAKSVTIFDTETFACEEIAVPFERDLRVIKGRYDDILLNAESDKRRSDFVKIVLEDRAGSQEAYTAISALYPHILHFEGALQEGVRSLSKLTADEISKLTPVELVEDYFKTIGKPECFGEFEKGWLEWAISKCERGQEDDT